MEFFGSFSFLNPWLLLGLTGLPLLWLILRITPPAPRLVKLPTIRFLHDLTPEKRISSKTPWWLLLLRLIILTCIITAFAHPVYKIAMPVTKDGDIRLIIENGWESAQNWETQTKAAENIITRAARGEDQQDFYILTTAAKAGEKEPAAYGPLGAGEARTILKSLAPLPWQADYTAALGVLDKTSARKIHSFWFSSGLSGPGFENFSQKIARNSNADIYLPDSAHLPVLLKKIPGNDLQAEIRAPDTLKTGSTFLVQMLSDKGALIDQQTLTWQSAGTPLKTDFKTPANLAAQAVELKILGKESAGTLYKMNEGRPKRVVGIIGGDGKNTKPFIDATYYIQRALEPYASMVNGDFNIVLNKNPSVIILPDIANIPPDILTRLQKWVEDGGLLLRFAGPNMAAHTGEQYLLPVNLRAGDRASGTALGWEKAAKLQNFPETSPLFNIGPPGDITIRRQILADSTEDLAKKTWASLDDGTPLITAAPLEKGLLVFVHTAALPEWSDLPISGAFVEILKHIVDMAGTRYEPETTITQTLHPLWVLDGFGNVKKPGATTRPVQAQDFKNLKPDSNHPPGGYGTEKSQQILNLPDHIENLDSVVNLPAAIKRNTYGSTSEKDYKPRLLIIALCLFLLDWTIMIVMTRGIRMRALTAILILLSATPNIGHAADFETDSKYAEGFYLAYIRTGDNIVDATSQKGLENLMKTLEGRTSAEPAGIAALDPEKDTLAFFPFIYWPISIGQQELTPQAIKNIQDYLDNGGTILFDTRDGSEATAGFGISSNAKKLQQILRNFNVPGLELLPKDHVLLRSFYLLNNTPGRFYDGTLWIESNSAPGRDGVSSILIGTYDWAGGWASPAISQQQEMSLRFGVNMVIYALTGNYKADQVHVSEILERLGQ